MPMVNQIEIHPLSAKEEMLQYCQKNNIQLVAWSPIMRGRVFSNELIINSLNESDSVSVSGVPDNTTYLKY